MRHRGILQISCCAWGLFAGFRLPSAPYAHCRAGLSAKGLDEGGAHGAEFLPTAAQDR